MKPRNNLKKLKRRKYWLNTTIYYLSRTISITVIGISAGPDTDRQILIPHGMIGLSITGRTPTFVRNIMNEQYNIQSTV
ncbi:TPA: 3-methyl-2-oxobutanoate hydroxymethyltransferase [Serratia liquefaciens]|nr:3-methyl-2-oxobutanoate hydroxymethyltransferase [Serratia liquefaciens]HED2334489.1 3-methyl-2-oxobutanoate hydroxymethyltransferase [Serratia liquefaciens]